MVWMSLDASWRFVNSHVSSSYEKVGNESERNRLARALNTVAQMHEDDTRALSTEGCARQTPPLVQLLSPGLQCLCHIVA